jgi:hypothetical protein
MTANPVDHLEIRALQQRNDVHETIGEFKHKVVEACSKLNLNTTAREHLLAAALIVSSLGFPRWLWRRRNVHS